MGVFRLTIWQNYVGGLLAEVILRGSVGDTDEWLELSWNRTIDVEATLH